MEAAIISTGSFPPIERAQWLEEARRPRNSTAGDTPTTPSYADRHFEQLRQRGAGVNLSARAQANWAMVQRVDDVDPRRAHHQAVEDIEGGATGLAMVFEGAPNAFGYGLPARPESLAAVLHNVNVNNIYLRVDVHPASRASVDWLIELIRRKKVDPARLSLSFGIDPAAIFAGNGSLRMSIEALQASMPPSLANFFGMGIPAVLLEADGRVVHNAGGTEAQELGVMLSSAVSCLRMFSEARQPLIYAAPHIGFALSVDHDQFPAIAKLKALRRLWAKIQETCGIPAVPAKIHVETSYRMMSAASVETNILRNTLAAAAAAAGGADTICVLPHTLPLGLAERRARRLALDAQRVLAQETHFASLADPTASTEDLDILTASFCEAAWNEFRQIQQEGGLMRSLAAGAIQKRVATARSQRLDAMRSGTSAITGLGGSEEAVPTLAATRRETPSVGVATCEPMPPIRFDALLAAG